MYQYQLKLWLSKKASYRSASDPTEVGDLHLNYISPTEKSRFIFKLNRARSIMYSNIMLPGANTPCARKELYDNLESSGLYDPDDHYKEKLFAGYPHHIIQTAKANKYKLSSKLFIFFNNSPGFHKGTIIFLRLDESKDFHLTTNYTNSLEATFGFNI